MGADDRLEKQIQFIIEIDKLKQIHRQTFLMDGSRQENSAEHSWHLTQLALVLCEYADPDHIDLSRVIQMVSIHDLVEIDAGDTFCYDTKGRNHQKAKEAAAAERIFGLLPADQADFYRGLWDEFESGQSAEARFARALDRIQPVLHNYYTQGKAWRRHGITREQVLDRNRHIEAGAPRLWAYIRQLIDDAVAHGYLEQ